jgi:hypothetical protein
MMVYQTVVIICPYCGEEIEEPTTGTYSWEPSDLAGRTQVVCDAKDCGRISILPKRASPA